MGCRAVPRSSLADLVGGLLPFCLGGSRPSSLLASGLTGQGVPNRTSFSYDQDHLGEGTPMNHMNHGHGKSFNVYFMEVDFGIGLVALHLSMSLPNPPVNPNSFLRPRANGWLRLS